MTSNRTEARKPPKNSLGQSNGGIVQRIIQLLKLYADLQVFTVSKHVALWLTQQRGSLLEVGCGDQPYRSLVPASCTYVGIDQTDASTHFDMVEDSDIIRYTGEQFPCADGAFDALFHTEVMEHVFHYQNFLSECRRVLKPDGQMMFTVPFQARYHFIPYDYFRYTPSSIEMLLTEAGFSEIVITPRGTDITIAAYKVLGVFFRWAYGNWRGKLLFLLTAPLTFLMLVIAHLSLITKSGSTDDCLGYSVTARCTPV